MEKEPKKSVAERSPRRLPATAARGEDGPGGTAVSREARPGILRELGQEVKEQVRPDRGYLSIDYFTLFWLFMTGCVFGLVVETAYHAIVFGGYESRPGLVWGPFSPIYGTGAVVLTVVAARFSHLGAPAMFLVAALVGSGVEVAAGWLMEVLFGAVAWDYSHR